MNLDEKFMSRAFELAANGEGYVSPNPLVGAVIVKNGEIVGEGWHRAHGMPHAEIEAINNSTLSNFKSSTIYITLEPCTHIGKTPPCAPVLIKKHFKRVVIGMTDPNPLVAGKGVEMLVQAGIEVETGVLRNEIGWQNRFFTKFITTGFPYLILKVAQSLNGAIATKSGISQWITGEESRQKVHELRSKVDAVLIGSGTTRFDNPSLTVRAVEGRQPFRIILDSSLSLAGNLNILTDEYCEKTVLCCTKSVSSSQKAKILRARGIQVLGVHTDKTGRLKLKSLLQFLASKLNIASIMVEGGASVFSNFYRECLFDEIRLFIAPKVIGKGLNAFSDIMSESIDSAPRLKLYQMEQFGDDICLTLIKK